MKRAVLASICLLFAPLSWAEPEIRLFFEAASPDNKIARAALQEIAAEWSDGYSIMFVDIARLMPADAPPRPRAGSASALEGASGEARGRVEVSSGAMPFEARGANGGGDLVGGGSPIRRRLMRFLRKQTGQKFGDDLDRWRRWIWSQPYAPHADYALFKAAVYRNIDPKMIRFFPPAVGASIRLDEIDWGGVAVNGIPPLDNPPMASASDADWMSDDDVVFGVQVDGEARAYPKRIIAWHELVRDRVGKTPITLVYCTLCGSVIPYDSRVDGVELTLGTSGLLYRSNKLMFDEQTQSLWSSIYGRAVVGESYTSEKQLTRLPVITTSWAEWRALHPKTLVLSEQTGFARDYREGAAYADYNATDELWFEVPFRDDRLKNKAEVLTLVVDGVAVAVTRERLLRERLLHHEVGETRLIFVTDLTGGTRVYRLDAREIKAWVTPGVVRDSAGESWVVTESALISDDGEIQLERIATAPSYWFGWVAQFPETELLD